jgi:hypothetical protein
MPSFETSDLLNRFEAMTYNAGWVQDVDWMEWSRGPEARRLLRDNASLAEATVDQIANVLTTIVRSARFNEGALAGYFKEGVLLALAERAEALLPAKA